MSPAGRPKVGVRLESIDTMATFPCVFAGRAFFRPRKNDATSLEQ